MPWNVHQQCRGQRLCQHLHHSGTVPEGQDNHQKAIKHRSATRCILAQGHAWFFFVFIRLLIIQNWKITLQLSYKKKKNKENKGGLGLKKYHSPSQQPHQDGWIILQNYISFLSKQAHQQEFKLQTWLIQSTTITERMTSSYNGHV